MGQLVTRVTVSGSRIEVVPGPDLRRFITGNVFFDYPGRDLSGIPEHIALVPFVWAAAPIIWATGVQSDIETLDERVASSLDEVHQIMRLAHPGLPWDGSLAVRSVAQPPALPAQGRFREALLFSGGLDSTFSALRHGGRSLLLLTAWGIDIPLRAEARWNAFLAHAEAFARLHAGGIQVVRTNVRSAMDYRRLNALAPEISRWWVDVQFGTTLTGLAAPVAELEGIALVHFAGLTKLGADEIIANGSFPRLDNAIVLGNAHVHHDGADMTRQDRINWLIADGRAAALRVCIGRPAAGQINCGRCLKCMRTIVGVVAAGGDPRRYGFDSYTPAVLRELPRRFAAHEFLFGWAESLLWEDIRDNMPPASSADPQLTDWLRTFDFAAYGAADNVEAARARALVRRLRAAAPWMAPIVAPMRQLRSVRRWLP